ncbi:bile acid:sodium symporter [Streptomyces sp. HSW2009]|uniref:arsenic resistance protein n=1 Tax=Streptomyces sp. HSW2009 TaxID=3142890 RepID=UPI0032ECE53F
MERHQIALYLGALAVGGAVGSAAPGAGPALEHAINPLLAALLYVTFLQVPAAHLVRSLREGRFLAAVLVLNFVLVPLVVAVLFVFLPGDRAVRMGFLLVLLAPCIDYVIVFGGLAGGSNQRLLAASPLLLLVQMVLLPGYLFLFLGSELADAVEVGPFVEAFCVLIVIPLALAWLTQGWAARREAGRRTVDRANALMVPLMCTTLAVVVGSQLPKLDDHLGDVARVIPLYAAFLVVMAFVGLAVTRAFGLDVPAGRAVVFSGATRNSLVVLPLALALPEELTLAATVVVTQTLVELVGMVVYVRAVPRLLPTPQPAPGPHRPADGG